MAESKSDRSPRPLSPEMLYTDKSPRRHKETHGKRNDIDENTSMDEVRAPNVFERVKEEIEALVQTIHPKIEPPICERRDETVVAESKEEKAESQSVVKDGRLIYKAGLLEESKPDTSKQVWSLSSSCVSASDSTVKAAKVFERAKDEIEKMLHIKKSRHQQKETHGQRDDIGEDTPLNEVKAPNVFERAVEEYEAFMQTIHSKKESQKCDKRDETANAASMQKKAAPLSENDAETHGRSNSIDVKMPINEVKGPNIFERAKDEMEALVHTIHHKKETDSPVKEGFGSKLGRCLEIICSPPKEKGDKSQNFA